MLAPESRCCGTHCSSSQSSPDVQSIASSCWTTASCTRSCRGSGVGIIRRLTPLMPNWAQAIAHPSLSWKPSPTLTILCTSARASSPLAIRFMISWISYAKAAAFQQEGWSGKYVSNADLALTMRRPVRAGRAGLRNAAALSCTQPASELVTMMILSFGSTRLASSRRSRTALARSSSSLATAGRRTEGSRRTAPATAPIEDFRSWSAAPTACLREALLIHEEHMSVSSQSRTRTLCGPSARQTFAIGADRTFSTLLSSARLAEIKGAFGASSARLPRSRRRVSEAILLSRSGGMRSLVGFAGTGGG
mmetsp:Transcript_4425/g.17405  ORF Transcript_4425/g.17405 Transcript_4425/m.17405 type:complete len:307 (-) Transcript_4425:163-1083(-)